jgi:hypothetical protein
LAASTGAPLRTGVLQALFRLNNLKGTDLPKYLMDADHRVVEAALSAYPKGEAIGDELRELAIRLANSPYTPVKTAARVAINRIRPTEPTARMKFDLLTEHPYFRLKIVDQLATAKEGSADGLLLQACANRNANTRARALKALAKRNPAKAMPQITKAFRDPSAWVRLTAAALAEEHAKAEQAEAIRKALEGEKDRATKLYLKGALAEATGAAMPEPQRPVNPLPQDRNATWYCGLGTYALDSPFDAYYQLSPRVSDTWKKAHRKGKVFFPRLDPVGNPGAIMVTPITGETFRAKLDSELNEENIPYIDGLVFGEETMSLKARGLWRDGWPLFCQEAGIDAKRVGGDLKKLSAVETRAWQNWAVDRSIEGFNLIYDYVKLKYGKLRPGIQVGTFLPGEASDIARTSVRNWKFDVGAVYDYKGDNRLACYSLLRRFKTIWPERRSLWLSLGIGGYEMNPVKYTTKTPKTPFFSRSERSYADTLTAWMAGADTGWFSVWIMVDKKFDSKRKTMSGTQLAVEDIGPKSPTLLKGIKGIYKGVEEERILQEETKEAPKAPGGDVDLKADKDDDQGDLATLDEDTSAEDLMEKVQKGIKTEQEAMRLGFNFYQFYVYDCVRVFSSLPQLKPKPKALSIRPGITTWTRPGSAHPMIPGAALLDQFDFLTSINMIPHIDITPYRNLTVHSPGALRDSTIERINTWLKEQPGLLYVHRYLSADNGDEDSTIHDMDGKLKADWLWENAVSIEKEDSPARKPKLDDLILKGYGENLTIQAAAEGSRFSVKGPAAKVLYAVDEKPVLVLWRSPDCKGAVLFDGIEHANETYLEALRKVINDLAAKGIGIPLQAPRIHVGLKKGHLAGASTTGYYRTVHEKKPIGGVDLLTGQRNVHVGGGRSAALTVSTDHFNRYLAVSNAIHALGEHPFLQSETNQGGLLLKNEGMVRITVDGKPCSVKSSSGKELTLIPEEGVTTWLVDGAGTEGIAHLTVGPEESKRTATYVRCKEAFQVTATQ